MGYPLLKDIQMLKNITWARSDLWEVRFSGSIVPQSPFDEWIPAVSIEEPKFSLTSHAVNGYFSEFKVPISTSSLSIRVTLVDNAEKELERYFTEWVEKYIFNYGKYITPVKDCVRQLDVLKYKDSYDNVPKISSYSVFPEGTLSYNGTASPEPLIHTFELVVWERLDQGLGEQQNPELPKKTNNLLSGQNRADYSNIG